MKNLDLIPQDLQPIAANRPSCNYNDGVDGLHEAESIVDELRVIYDEFERSSETNAAITIELLDTAYDVLCGWKQEVENFRDFLRFGNGDSY